MTLMDFPDEFSSVTQRDLAVPSPPIVEKMYVYVLCKFVGDDDDDDDDDDGDDDDDDDDGEKEEEEEEENMNRKI